MTTSSGRPSKFSPLALRQTTTYLSVCILENRIPFIEELALHLQVNDDTLVEWSKVHDEFSATIKRLKMIQRLQLQKDALQRKIHPSMAIFLLKANHGLRENSPAETGKHEPITVIFKDYAGKALEEPDNR